MIDLFRVDTFCNSVFSSDCAMKPSVALTTALSGAYLARAIVVMIIVGSVLNLINQGEALFQGAPLNFAKLLLTYVVPFCVSTYGTWSALIAAR